MESVPPTAVSPVLYDAPGNAGKEAYEAEGQALKRFFHWAPGQFNDLKWLCDKVIRTGSSNERREKLKDFFSPVDLKWLRDKVTRKDGSDERLQKLRDLRSQVLVLKSRASLPGLLPVSLLASALEGLLNQLIDRASEVTPSTLRTVDGAIELLKEICTPGLKADLATEPPVRLLAVDDDPISRYAVCTALKKTFNQPDTAENGKAALVLCNEHRYDAIFLDVMMPGMDGFELCAKIQETATNRATPVVFVTCLKDFDSWTKSIASGGTDLIAKPFLTYEIAVKALTLILAARSKASSQTAPVSEGSDTLGVHLPVPVNQTEGKVEAVAWPAPPSADQSLAARNSLQEMVQISSKGQRGSASATPPPTSTSDENELFASVSENVDAIRELVQVITRTTDESTWQKMLLGLHPQFQSLLSKISQPELRAASQVCSALEGLLKKLINNPKNITPTTPQTVAMAVDLLKDLCTKGINPDLATVPAIRILVVDDEPLSRRALVGALQTAFFRPDSADGGVAALALATEKVFDLALLDAQMPGMNGFELCNKIHETAANRNTPVVFVTSHADFRSLPEAAHCQYSDFVVKPFPFVEINVKALTFALRRRLQDQQTASYCESAP